MYTKHNLNTKNTVSEKYKPKSRVKYETNNPNWTVRMPLPWHGDYERYVKRLGLSRREFMAVALEKIKIDYEQIRTQAYNEGFAVGRKQGHQEGYAEGERLGYQNGHKTGFSEGKQIGNDQGTIDWRIWYYCYICGGLVFVKPGSEEHKVIIDFFANQGWAHHDCANGRFYR